MQLHTDAECRKYVESQIAVLVNSNPRFHGVPSHDVPVRSLSWEIGRAPAGSGSYTLEARMQDQEFLIWFGNHQVGAMGIHWIMRPAVHVAFHDLWPRGDRVGIRHSLSEVLTLMFATLDAPGSFMTRFEPNTFSIT